MVLLLLMTAAYRHTDEILETKEEIHHACNAVAFWLPDAEQEACKAQRRPVLQNH